MRRADRLFQLVQLLRSRGFTTAEKLAREVGVSKRTIYRDIRDLELSGVPVRGEAGVGYQLERGFELPPLTFNSEEIEALVLGARIVSAWGDSDLAEAARGAMTKVEAVLPEGLREVFLNTPLFAPGRPNAAHLGKEMAVLRRAIASRHSVRFGYRRADGEDSERTVRPLALYFWGTKWTLASWCEYRRDYRSFRPDRMGKVQILDETFDGGDGIHLEAFLDHVEARNRESGEWGDWFPYGAR